MGAARAAAEIRSRFAADTGADLRIGLHLGEVTWDEDGVYGDAVNVASRLQAIAIPGSALMSAALASRLGSSRDISFIEVGPVRLKNVDEPVRVFALTLGGLGAPTVAEVERRARGFGGGEASDGP